MRTAIRKILFIATAVLILLSSVPALSTSAGAEEPPKQKTVRVGTEDSGFFVLYNTKKEPDSGYAYSYLETIASYAGWNVEYVFCSSFDGCLEALENGDIDIVYDVSKTPEREKTMLFPAFPMGSEDYYLFCRVGNPDIVPGDRESYMGKKVGVTSGTTQVDLLHEWCKKEKVDFDIVEFISYSEKREAFDTRQIDMDFEISLQAEDVYSAVEKIGTDDYYLAIRKDRPDLVEDVNEACRILLSIDPGYLNMLQEKYFSRTVISRTLTEAETEWVSAHDVLRVGYREDYQPYSGTAPDGSPSGIVKDYVPLMLHNIGIEERMDIEYVAFENSESMYEALRTGAIDTAFPASGSIAYAKKQGANFTSSVISVAQDIIFKESLASETVRTVALNMNNLTRDFELEATFQDMEVLICGSTKECLEAVKNGSADITVLNGLQTTAVLAQERYQDLIAARRPGSRDYSFAVRTGNAPLLSLLNRAIANTDDSVPFTLTYQYMRLVEPYTAEEFFQDNFLVFLLILGLVGVLAALISYMINNRKLLTANREILEQQAEIRLAQEKAEIASKAKSTFLFNMSHDIRTPLNAIIGFTKLAQKNQGNPKAQAKDHLKILESGELLLSMIDGILDMTSAEAGKNIIDEKPADIMYSFATIKDAIEILSVPKDLKMSYDYGTVTDRYVYADVDKVTRVLMNIISNAVKYTKPGGSIYARCEQIGNRDDRIGIYRYTVEDTGIGMSEEFQKHVFEPFSREHSSTDSGVTGIGLGLPMVKSYVEMLKGTITLNSKEGSGTTVTIELPFRLQEDQNNPKRFYWELFGQLAQGDNQSTPEENTLAGKKALIVEDNELNMEITRSILSDLGIEADSVENGAVAVQLLQEQGAGAYDFILMDIQMPVMDGYEATRKIRELFPNWPVPIIAVSANALDEDIKKSRESGMNGHVGKPINVEQMKETMERANEEFRNARDQGSPSSGQQQ